MDHVVLSINDKVVYDSNAQGGGTTPPPPSGSGSAGNLWDENWVSINFDGKTPVNLAFIVPDGYTGPLEFAVGELQEVHVQIVGPNGEILNDDYSPGGGITPIAGANKVQLFRAAPGSGTFQINHAH